MSLRVSSLGQSTTQKKKSKAPYIEPLGVHMPVLMRCSDQAAIAVRVRGVPAPVVTWYVGRKPVRDGDAVYRATVEGMRRRRHVLFIESVSEELEGGVWIKAKNEHGEDLSAVGIKTYRGIHYVGRVRAL